MLFSEFEFRNRIIAVRRMVFGLDDVEDVSEGHSVFECWSSEYIKFGCSVSLELFWIYI
jgi:hypothetical protein